MAEAVPFNTKISTSFRHDIIKELIRSKFSNTKTKLSDDVVELMVELTKTMVIEAASRACYQASLEDKAIVTLDHVEIILPQMMLDFP